MLLGSFVNDVFFDHATIDAWIAEDAPLLDLTTHLLAIGKQTARIQFTVRHDTVAACTEEAARIVQHCGGQVQQQLASGTPVSAGTVLLSATGDATGLLRAWKVAQNLLEYACGVAGATGRMVQTVQAVAPHVAVLTTRKHAPGLRRIALKATLSGGAFPHRLGVGETVLVFPQHRALVGDWHTLQTRLSAAAPALAEKKCVIEVQSLDDAFAAIHAGADVLQFDKVTPTQLHTWCPQLREQHPRVGLLAAGGITLHNAVDYATSGVNALVTSSLHHAPPADVGVSVTPQISPGTGLY